MNVLILHAHPEPKSFTSALKDLAVEHYEGLGNEVIVNDLYKMNFNPVGGPGDFNIRQNNEFFSYLKEQMNAFKTDSFSSELKEEMEKLKWADLVVLNFPLWWSSMPAILKGWFDRVIALGFAYHPREMLYQTGAFKGKKAYCAITTGGSKQSYSEGGANGDIMQAIYHINHGLLYYCGMDVLPPFFAWRAHLSTPEELREYLKEYKNYLNNFDNLKPMY